MNENILTDTAFGAIRSMPLKIVVSGIGELLPADDITPLESAHIAMLLGAASLRLGAIGYNFMDYATFIKEHKLERHFKP